MMQLHHHHQHLLLEFSEKVTPHSKLLNLDSTGFQKKMTSTGALPNLPSISCIPLPCHSISLEFEQ